MEIHKNIEVSTTVSGICVTIDNYWIVIKDVHNGTIKVDTSKLVTLVHIIQELDSARLKAAKSI